MATERHRHCARKDLRRIVLPAFVAAGFLASPAVSPLSAAQDPTVTGTSSDGDASRPPDALDLGTLLASPPPTPAAREDALVRLEEAMEEWRDDEDRDPADRVDQILAALPALADWLPLIRAELLAPTGDTAAVRAALARLDPRGEYRSRWGWTFLVEAYEEADDPRGAAQVAVAAAESAERADRAARAWQRAGELALESGDTTSARRALREAIALGPDLGAAGDAARIIDRLPSHPDEDARAVGEALLADGAWAGALRRLTPLLERDVYAPDRAAEVRVELGRGLVELRRYDEANRMFAPVLRETGTDEELVAESLYWLGRGALDRGAVGEAAEHFRRLAAEVPDAYEAELGLTLLLERELETGFGPRARALLEELLTIGVRGSTAVRHVIQLATSRYLESDYADAEGILRRHLDAGGGGSRGQQAAYWTALTLERLGHTDEARSHLEAAHAANPLGFYGVMAGERIGAPVLSRDTPEGPPPTPGLETELANALLRLHVHRFVPTSGSFAFELDRLTNYFMDRGTSAYDFAEALIEGGFPLQGAVVGREIHDREERWNLRLLRIVHPLPHRDAILREARARGLDPFFVAGTIRQESMFDAGIVSAAGAVGLMQLLPSTARELARSLGLRYSDEFLEDPEYNLRLGTEFLSDLVRRFDGRAEDALVAYNAGPGRIARWRQEPAWRDGDVFVEHIPFAETRDYVKVVQSYARIYAALYGCGDFEPCLGLSYPEVVARSSVAGGAPRSSLGRE